MDSTNFSGCHARRVERVARPAPTTVERTEPTMGLAADWLVRRYRVRPILAATVALHAGFGGGERRGG